MKSNRHSILQIVFACVVALTLLAPSFVKLSHVFENHKHEVCETPQTTHYHELDVDCEFYKFKLNTQYSIHFSDVEFIEPQVINSEITSQYNFVSAYQRLQFSLRGPPVLV